MQFILQKRYNAAHFLHCMLVSFVIQTEACTHTHSFTLRQVIIDYGKDLST